jgi:hypothetical protein
MHYHWLKDHVAQKQFDLYWALEGPIALTTSASTIRLPFAGSCVPTFCVLPFTNMLSMPLLPLSRLLSPVRGCVSPSGYHFRVLCHIRRDIHQA